jgi:hypothetical protein
MRRAAAAFLISLCALALHAADRDEAVYQAAGDWTVAKTRSAAVVLLSETRPLCPAQMCVAREDIERGLSEATCEKGRVTIEAFLAANRTPAPVPPLAGHYTLASVGDVYELIVPNITWQDFYRHYRGVWGFISFSRPAYSEDGSTAVIYAGFHCGDECRVERLLVLKKGATGWTVACDAVLRD